MTRILYLIIFISISNIVSAQSSSDKKEEEVKPMDIGIEWGDEPKDTSKSNPNKKDDSPFTKEKKKKPKAR